MRLLKINAAGLLLLTTCSVAQAIGEGPDFSVNGFGSLGVVRSSETQADFAPNILKPDGAGFTRRWSFEPDSRLGIQFTGHLAERWTGILQVISELQHDDSYRPQVEWANLKYDVTPRLSIRAGRIAVPTFLAGDYRKVGFAVPWVRPPGEVYGLNPVSNNDGLDVLWTLPGEQVRQTLQVFAGRKDVEAPDNIVAQARDSFGAGYTAEVGNLTTHLYYQQARLNIPALDPLFNGFRMFGPPGIAIADRFGNDNKRFQVFSIGATYDLQGWFVTGEWAKVRSRSWLGDKRGWYLGSGYAFGKFTPYLLYAQADADSPVSVAGLSTAGLPPPVTAQATVLNQELNRLLAFTPVQKTIAIGTRWDVARNAALKVQYEYTDIGAGSAGPLVNPQPGFRRGGDVRLFSVVLDFVF